MITGWRRRLCILLAVVFSVMLPVQAWAATVDVTIGVGETTVLFQGSTAPGTLVTFVDDGTVIGSTTTNPAGSYSQLLTDQTPGLHTYQVYGQDTDGRFTDTVSVSVNVPEHAQTTITVFLPPTLRLSDNEVTQGTKVTAEGSTFPGASVVLYIDDAYVTTTADSNGNWQHELDSATLAVGEHQLYALANKSGGEQSHATQVRTLIVTSSSSPNPTTPTPPIPGTSPGSSTPTPNQSGGVPETPIITLPKPNTTVTSDTVEVVGTAEPGTQIEVWNRDRIVGSTFTDSNGTWRLTVILTEFANELKARACRGELCSGFSPIVPLFRQRSDGDGITLRLNRYRLRSLTKEQVAVKAYVAGGQKPYKLRVDWGDKRHDSFTTKQSPLLLSHHFQRAGKYKGVVTATDDRGQTARVFFSTDVQAPTQRPALWPFIILLLLLLLLILLARRFLVRRNQRSSNA